MTEHEIRQNLQAIINSPSYKIAYQDLEFIGLEELRPLRLELELLKPEMFLREAEVENTIVSFGGTQILEKQDAEEELRKAKLALEKSPGDKKA